MRRQLIVCCDGTSNTVTGGDQDTNVLKLKLFLDRKDPGQVVFYDPGVGNPGGLPGVTVWDRIGRTTDQLMGLALGRGIYENVAEAYLFLMRNYRVESDPEKADQIFIFGFSRGAFTARSVSGMVRMFGILPSHLESLVPTLLSIYFADKQGEAEIKSRSATAQIRDHFAQPAEVHLVGVWDTVASVGMWPFVLEIPASTSIKGKSILHVRQALALDEHRAPFKPRIYSDPNGDVIAGRQTVKQVWFRGSHCDAGGGYAIADSRTSHEALAWMLFEAQGVGLRLGDPGGPFAGEADVLKALASRFPGTPDAMPIHSQVHENCLWAIAGLRVRNPTDIGMQLPPGFKAEEHRSVDPPQRAFPADTAWSRPRDHRRWLLGIAAAIILFLYIGFLQHVPSATEGWLPLERFASANWAFLKWQVLWPFRNNGLFEYANFASPRGAILADFLFIGLYAYVLAYPLALAFARWAGLRRVSMEPPRALNFLGRTLKYAVVADLAENVMALLAISLALDGQARLAYGAAAIMTLAAIAKLAALGGVLVLIVGSRFRRVGVPV